MWCGPTSGERVGCSVGSRLRIGEVGRFCMFLRLKSEGRTKQHKTTDEARMVVKAIVCHIVIYIIWLWNKFFAKIRKIFDTFWVELRLLEFFLIFPKNPVGGGVRIWVDFFCGREKNYFICGKYWLTAS